MIIFDALFIIALLFFVHRTLYYFKNGMPATPGRDADEPHFKQTMLGIAVFFTLFIIRYVFLITQ